MKSVSMDRILNTLDELRAIFEHVYSITNEDGSLWVVVNTFRRNHELIQLPFDIARVCKT